MSPSLLQRPTRYSQNPRRRPSIGRSVSQRGRTARRSQTRFHQRRRHHRPVEDRGQRRTAKQRGRGDAPTCRPCGVTLRRTEHLDTDGSCPAGHAHLDLHRLVAHACRKAQRSVEADDWKVVRRAVLIDDDPTHIAQEQVQIVDAGTAHADDAVAVAADRSGDDRTSLTMAHRSAHEVGHSDEPAGQAARAKSHVANDELVAVLAIGGRARGRRKWVAASARRPFSDNALARRGSADAALESSSRRCARLHTRRFSRAGGRLRRARHTTRRCRCQ